MSLRIRIALAILGLALAVCSLVMLAYTVWPQEDIRVSATVEPALMAPP
jgi:hypothetical protein